MNKFNFLKVYNSPFITPKIRFYVGKLQYGTPIFYPRRWVKSKEKDGYLTTVPKYIGFDFVGLGWKIKWESYRHEWNPIWSFVFFKWQFCIFFDVPHYSHYWESWLYYELDTDKKLSKSERIKQCIEQYPQIWSRWSKDGEKETIDYYTKILKKEYL